MKRFLLWVCVPFLLWSCSSQADRTQNAFYADMVKAQTALADVQSLVKSSKFAKVRYTERVNRMIPVAQQELKKYQNSPQAAEPAYRHLKKSFEHYVMADHLWKQDKGLVMVNQRLADAEKALQRGGDALKELK